MCGYCVNRNVPRSTVNSRSLEGNMTHAFKQGDVLRSDEGVVYLFLGDLYWVAGGNEVCAIKQGGHNLRLNSKLKGGISHNPCSTWEVVCNLFDIVEGV